MAVPSVLVAVKRHIVLNTDFSISLEVDKLRHTEKWTKCIGVNDLTKCFVPNTDDMKELQRTRNGDEVGANE